MLDERKQKKDGTYPLKLRITHLRKRYYFGIDESLTPEDWKKVTEAKGRGRLKELSNRIADIEAKARQIIDGLGAFTIKRFEDVYNGVPVQDSGTSIPKDRTVYKVFDAYVANLRAEDRAGTASSYNTALVSLRKFSDSPYFEDITPTFLTKYEKTMTDSGNSLTTVGMYLRALRTIFNYAIEKGIVQSNFYPFGKRKYQIPTGANVKKALTKDDVVKITNYKPKNPGTIEEQARDLWLLIYACNGMNIKDLCNLKYSNIQGNKISFIRQKTERTTRSNPKPVIAHLPEIAVAIIERWGQKPKHPDTYIFRFYEPGMDAERRFVVSKQVVHNINRWLKTISAELGIEIPVTTYTARHTFSTVLKRSGASIEFISESLGHTDMRTTESYLASFEDDLREEMSKRLF
ncbi:MAG: site-specific integrase [Bacteroidota bacterium]